jgi:hypothetical protein
MARPGLTARHRDRSDGLRTATDTDDQSLQVRLLLQDLERHGGGAGDHPGIVRRVNGGQAPLLRQARRDRDRLVVVSPLFDERRAVSAHRLVLLRVVAEGDADRGGDSEKRCGPGHAQAVIAPRGGDDAAAPLFLGEDRHGGEGVARLERVGRVVVLVLDPDGDAASDRVVQRGVAAKWRGREVGADPAARLQHVVEGDRPDRFPRLHGP